ncbi:hypothetical protein NDU88_002713 [Pleurodeles waltl]|uniref:Uncharacterized protein n=1 Tax=Pleurodeles waltl TaxID=8319 RepID=A0AAV7NG74_PLEWA|nr:hypothetical protein NDU88_002713 [Pleurodeles waltl]
MGGTQSDEGQTGKPSPSEDNVLTRRSSKEAPVWAEVRHSNVEKRRYSENMQFPMSETRPREITCPDLTAVIDSPHHNRACFLLFVNSAQCFMLAYAAILNEYVGPNVS